MLPVFAVVVLVVFCDDLTTASKVFLTVQLSKLDNFLFSFNGEVQLVQHVLFLAVDAQLFAKSLHVFEGIIKWTFLAVFLGSEEALTTFGSPQWWLSLRLLDNITLQADSGFMHGAGLNI